MSFFVYAQNNSGGSFRHDSRGISVNVIIEAPDAHYADNRAESIGIYFDGCDSGADCDCCGDRWYAAYGPGEPVPTVGESEVQPGELFPAADDPRRGLLATKWMAEGTPEGYIHYLDGRVEPFWADTAERQDLDGSFGYGVNFHPNWAGPDVFMVTSNGYDVTGNKSSAGKASGNRWDTPWAKPDKPVVRVDRSYGGNMLQAWFPTEDEANAFAIRVTMVRSAITDAISAAVAAVAADDVIRGDTPKRQYTSIVGLWKP